MSYDLDAAFEKDLQDRPEVYKILRRFALEAARHRPGERIGMKAVVERARWELHIRKGGDHRMFNNNLTSRYARLLAEREPELADVFEFRTLHKADDDRPQFDHLHVEESGQVAMPV